MFARFCMTASVLTLLSTPAMAQLGPGGLFDRFDANADGAVSLEEVRAWRATFFETADTDANGYVTREEIEAMQARAAENAPETGRAGRGPRGMRGQQDPIARSDSDGDGQLSRAEYVDAPFPALDRFDANGDGQLTRDELPGRRRGG